MTDIRYEKNKESLKIITKFQIILLFFLTTVFSYKKSAPSVDLPPITESGKNTFGCKVNGQVWVPYWRCSSIWTEPPQLEYEIQPIDSTSMLPVKIMINAGNSTNGQTYFSFRQNYSLSDHIYGPGNIIDSIIIEYRLGAGTTYANSQVYQFSSTDRYFQISKLDTTNKIVSGTFAFTLYTIVNNLLDSVVVTDGRFDLQIGGYLVCSQ